MAWVTKDKLSLLQKIANGIFQEEYKAAYVFHNIPNKDHSLILLVDVNDNFKFRVLIASNRSKY